MVTLHSLPLFVRMAGRSVILLGDGEAAAAKRRLLDRAGAVAVAEHGDAALAIVAIDDEAAALAAVGRLRARGILVNAVDRPEACDFTLPAIVDRHPVLIAVATGGVSAGLAAALRQRLEAWLPPGVGRLADALQAARAAIRARYPAADARRRALGTALSPGGALDPFHAGPGAIAGWLAQPDDALPASELVVIRLTSADPDDLTLGQARALALADQVWHRAEVSAAILDRARADAVRIVAATFPAEVAGRVVWLQMAER